jgi:hypothetical protein
MGDIRGYLLRLIAAAMVCWMAHAMMKKDTPVAAIGKLLCGVFMALTVLSPMMEFRIPDLMAYAEDYSTAAAQAAAMGQNFTNGAMTEIIKQRCASYILDKAREFGAELTVDIQVTEDFMPVPCAVTITGAVSPYARLRLGELITANLGIGEEAQFWKS